MKDKNIRKIIVFTFIIFVSSLLIFIGNGTATPDKDSDCDSCHSEGGYEISTTSDLEINTGASTKFTIKITASGNDVAVQAPEDARDNEKFTFDPGNDEIEDDSSDDENSDADEVEVEFEIKAPSKEGSYTIIIIAKDPDASKPKFAYLEFEINVGVRPTVFEQAYSALFNHLNIYLGGFAVLCLITATVLYQKNAEKYTKIHGLLAATALILTTINIIFIIPQTVSVLNASTTFTDYNFWIHFFHIVIGATGYIAGVVAILTGWSGIRTKKPGYIALLCWSFNFIQGLYTWGIRL